MKSELEPLFPIDTESMPYRLANVPEGDDPFISCYLDTRAGKSACVSYLDSKAAHIRGSLRGTERFKFDNAIEMIRGALEAHWNAQAQGMAVFARGVSNERFLSAMHFASPVENRLVQYALPEVLPLIALLQREPAFSLVLLNDHRTRLFECRPGSLATEEPLDGRLPAGEIGPDDSGSAGDGASPRWSRPDKGVVWRLRKALAASSSPLLIAGDVETLSRAADWLPQSVVARLVGSIPIKSDTGVEEALKTARERLDAIYRSETNRLAEALAAAPPGPAAAVFGYRSTLRAIRQAQAATVVIADWDNPGLGLPWEAEIEICSEALRYGVRVVLGDSVSLREAGGVGCWLREEISVASLPRRGRQSGLQSVA